VPQKASRWNLSDGLVFSKAKTLQKSGRREQNRRGKVMLNLVVTLLIIALIAAVLGFGGIAMAAVGLAKVIFFLALLLFLIAVLAGSLRAV
jgi:uncharacterized membrane protein YtjA (UPF0391 family)